MRGFVKPTKEEEKLVEKRFREMIEKDPDMTEEEKKKMVEKLMAELKY